MGGPPKSDPDTSLFPVSVSELLYQKIKDCVFLGQSVDILLSKKSWPCMERNISTAGASHMMTP